MSHQTLLDDYKQALAAPPKRTVRLEPVDFSQVGPLRPFTLAQMVGQGRLKALLGQIVTVAKVSRRPLDHMLLVGSAGTGKTTLGQVIAHEMGTKVYMLKAPVSFDVFEELARVAQDGDVVFIDEIHLQVSGDRRGITQAADPETFYHVMEDQRLITTGGPQPFPACTFIGATTDAGLLPEPFLDRFPLKPQLDEYTEGEMTELASRNAKALGVVIAPEAARCFARASRGIPRQINTYVKNAKSFAATTIDGTLAVEIVVELNSTTLDGLTRDMQNMLRFLLHARHENAGGRITYKAGLGSIATALGKSRDSKAVALYVEPILMKRGLIAVTSGGRELTPAGVTRAEEL
jgi:Holliday junction DNA helicase RuvB